MTEFVSDLHDPAYTFDKNEKEKTKTIVVTRNSEGNTKDANIWNSVNGNFNIQDFYGSQPFNSKLNYQVKV